jgi:hypothetical protein
MSASFDARPRFSFQAKITLTLAAVAGVDRVFWDQHWGSTLGLAALALAVCALVLHREVCRDRAALIAAAAAGAFALVLIDRPSPLAWLMFWTSLTLAVLLPRARFDDAWRWFQRLVFHSVVAVFGPLIDVLRLVKLRRKTTRRPVTALIATLALPLIGGAVFLTLFHEANPIISDMMGDLRLPQVSVFRATFWGLVVVTVWGVFRPRRLRNPLRLADPDAKHGLPGVSIASVTLSLLVFNALFALQNGLDIAFLWSGARLPDGVTMAQYAHRVAYPLILTALLAGLFVLAALRPGSPTGENRMIRRLVTFWVAQNVFLVASSILRTLDYIDAYSLTWMRIAALAWMGLVALGLVLIVWRLLRGKSAAWLINANALAAMVVLAVSSAVDYDAIAAAWNIRHAREMGGHGVALDLCYLNEMGPPALVALAELDRLPSPPVFADRVRAVRQDVTYKAQLDQAHDYGWTWRDQRRLARATAIAPPPPARFSGRLCDGGLVPPAKIEPPPAPTAPSPLTSGPPS